jgi:hypothetical protein
MKFLSDIRLLILAIWFGAAVFFIAVAQTAFAVLPDAETAGTVVSHTLRVLNYGAVAVAILMLLTSLIGADRISAFWLWTERFVLLIVGAAGAIGQFVIGYWLSAIRAQAGQPIEQLAADDPLRVQFTTLHDYSVWVLMAGMAAALIGFFIIANRKFGDRKAKSDIGDIYDFSNEFKT